jgi:hypothetical protein
MERIVKMDRSNDIELLKQELNSMVFSDDAILCEGELLEKSQELDVLIYTFYNEMLNDGN